MLQLVIQFNLAISQVMLNYRIEFHGYLYPFYNLFLINLLQKILFTIYSIYSIKYRQILNLYFLYVIRNIKFFIFVVRDDKEVNKYVYSARICYIYFCTINYHILLLGFIGFVWSFVLLTLIQLNCLRKMKKYIYLQFKSKILIILYQNSIIIKYKMISKSLTNFKILKPINSIYPEDFINGQEVITNDVKINKSDKEIFKLSLINSYLVLSMKLYEKIEYSQAEAYICLDDSITFQKILIIKEAHQAVKQTSKPKNCIGFKITDKLNNQIQFLLQDPQKTEAWIIKLSRTINQTGFHRFYKPIRKIGKGSSSSVYQIIRIQDGVRFVAKVFSKQYVHSKNERCYSFRNQLKLLKQLDSPCLLKLQEVFETNSSYYLITQYLKGKNLYEYIINKAQLLKLQEIRLIMYKLLNILSVLQSYGIVHRDIKLENIMLRDPKNFDFVLIDFGLAVSQNDEQYAYYQCGTTGYLAPETFLLQKGQKVSYKSDIFSVGAIFHILLTQKYLFQGKSQKQIFENNKKLNFDLKSPIYSAISKQSLDLMEKMLKIDQRQRWTVQQCLNHKFFEKYINKGINKQQQLTTNQSYQS